jgi:hypothetical protein
MAEDPFVTFLLSSKAGLAGPVIAGMPWEKSSAGPLQSWSRSLRTSVSICLLSRFPMVLFLGSDLIMLYNDAYALILGDKHPAALGRSVRDCWPEIWHIVRPMLEGVLTSGKATWVEDQLLLLNRNGLLQERCAPCVALFELHVSLSVSLPPSLGHPYAMLSLYISLPLSLPAPAN